MQCIKWFLFIYFFHFVFHAMQKRSDTNNVKWGGNVKINKIILKSNIKLCIQQKNNKNKCLYYKYQNNLVSKCSLANAFHYLKFKIIFYHPDGNKDDE